MPSKLTIAVVSTILMLGQGFVPAKADMSDYEYLVINQPARALLAELSRHTHTRINVSDTIRGHLNHVALRGTVPEILDQLASEMGWDVFSVNGIHYISESTEATTRFVRLGAIDLAKVRESLLRSGLDIPDYPISAAADDTALIMSGPPKLLALREAVIAAIPQSEPKIALPAPPERVVIVRRAGKAEPVTFEGASRQTKDQ